MAEDFTDWLVRSLGLPLLEDTPRGGVRVNDEGRRKLGNVRPAGLSDGVARCCGLPAATVELTRAVAAARAGAFQEVTLGGLYRVALAPSAKGRASALIAPVTAVTRIQDRAAAVDLAASVSHELANALGAIAGWAHLARSGGNVDEALSVIETSAESAWSVARHMLGRATGRHDVAPSVTDASALVQQVSRVLAPRARQANVQIEARVAEGITVTGAHSDLWSIVWNLTLNAIEAMPNGGTVLVQLTGTAKQALLVVADDGPGVSAELKARIFEPYVSSKASGSGIGLATVKRAVAAMGGKISLESGLGHGARFEVRLVRKPVDVVSARTRRARVDSEHSSGVFRSERISGRILVVDDDAALREMTATALTMRGLDVVAVASGRDALAAEGKFELALVDMMLPDLTGDVLLKDLRARGKVDAALLVTGSDVAQMPLVDGGEPDGVLRKPFHLDDLFERVAELLASDGTHRPARRMRRNT